MTCGPVGTSRVASKWGDRIPHVVKAGDVGASGDALIVQSVAIDRGDNDDIWIVNGKPGMPENSQPTPVGCAGNSEIPTNSAGMTKAVGRFGVRLRISRKALNNSDPRFPPCGDLCISPLRPPCGGDAEG